MFHKLSSSAIFRFGFLVAFCLASFVAGPFRTRTNWKRDLGGTVMDPSGAAVADAELTLVSQATSFEAKATSNERGEYTFRNVTPGTYDLKVVKAGFQTTFSKGIVLTINQSGRADATLKVGTTSETVTVEGEKTLINYDNGTVQEALILKWSRTCRCRVGQARSSASFAVLSPACPQAAAMRLSTPESTAV